MDKIISFRNVDNAVSTARDLSEAARHLVDSARSDSTRRAYAVQWANFEAFCSAHAVEPLPAAPETAAMYVAQLVKNGRSASTIGQAMAAISAAHVAAGFDSPAKHAGVKLALRGARREVGTAPHKKAAAGLPVLRALVDALDLSTVKGLRDRALLLMGFAGAFRRSELAALEVGDIERTQGSDGKRVLVVTVQRSKTDQEGQGKTKAIFTASKSNRALCPVAALDAYMTAAGIVDGKIFRQIRRGDHVTADGLTGNAVATVVKNAAAAAGCSLDLSGHSLRSGFITAALMGGASERSVMNQTGHKSVTVMRGYMQRVDALTDNAAANVL